MNNHLTILKIIKKFKTKLYIKMNKSFKEALYLKINLKIKAKTKALFFKNTM